MHIETGVSIIMNRWLEAEKIRIFNPGSISLPKSQTPHSFGFFDGTELIHCNL